MLNGVPFCGMCAWAIGTCSTDGLRFLRWLCPPAVPLPACFGLCFVALCFCCLRMVTRPSFFGSGFLLDVSAAYGRRHCCRVLIVVSCFFVSAVYRRCHCRHVLIVIWCLFVSTVYRRCRCRHISVVVSLIVWLFDCLIIWLFGYLVVWLFGFFDCDLVPFLFPLSTDGVTAIIL